MEGEQAPRRLLESINETQATTWDEYLNSRPTDEASKEIVGELVSLAAVSFFEDTRKGDEHVSISPARSEQASVAAGGGLDSALKVSAVAGGMSAV